MVLKRLPRGKLHKSKGESPHQIHSDQMVLGAVRWEAGPHERWQITLKTKLAQGGPSDLSQIRWLS